MFIYASSIFLTSTAFVDTKAKYGIPLSRYTVFLKTVLKSIALCFQDFFICAARHNIICVLARNII